MAYCRTLCLPLMVLSLCSCARVHPHRVPGKQVRRLAETGQPFVLVFGSLHVLQGYRDVTRNHASAGTAIRFIYQALPSDPPQVLNEIAILSGDRFFAVLKPPAAARELDHFLVQVRCADPAYEPVTHIRLSGRHTGLALYIGRIEATLAEAELERIAPKRILSVRVVNDFESARAELHRLYPRFDGEVRKSPALR